jgi:hypothetical protein
MRVVFCEREELSFAKCNEHVNTGRGMSQGRRVIACKSFFGMKHALVASFRKGQKKISKNIWQRIGTVYLCNPI